MKTAVATSLIIIALIAPAMAGKKHKGGGKPPPPQQQPAPPPPPAGPQPPSVRLSQFTAAHLDRILAPIDQRPALPRTEVAQLQASFADEAAKAPDPGKAPYQTAIAVCIALNTAMDEREQTLASLQNSASVHGPSDLGAHRKDNPTKRELKRERQEENNRKQEAAQNDDFLTTQLKTNWTKRALQIRQHIQILSERQRQAERSAEQARAPAPPPAAPPSATPH